MVTEPDQRVESSVKPGGELLESGCASHLEERSIWCVRPMHVLQDQTVIVAENIDA